MKASLWRHMGRQKNRREEIAKPAGYEPFTWVQISGKSIEEDAQWTAAIGGRHPNQARERRIHEIQRLAHFHGKEYARRVQARVVEIFKDAAKLAEARERFKRIELS